MPSAARSRRLPEPWVFFLDRSLGGRLVFDVLPHQPKHSNSSGVQEGCALAMTEATASLARRGRHVSSAPLR